uniref:Uncharacterized protein n=1 Tax=Romanomermis culicivorax TaxID=13658 RepID=A0A915LAU4_ROMCU
MENWIWMNEDKRNAELVNGLLKDFSVIITYIGYTVKEFDIAYIYCKKYNMYRKTKFYVEIL